MPFRLFGRKDLNARYLEVQGEMADRGRRLAAQSSLDVEQAASRIGEQCGIVRKQRKYSAYGDVAAVLLGEFQPVVAYFVAVAINEQFAQPLGYVVIGQIFLAIEHIDEMRPVFDTEWLRAHPGVFSALTRSPERTANAAEILACALLNFPEIDTARRAFGVYTVKDMRTATTERLRTYDEELARYIAG
jgi:hypothetical protein